MDQEKKKAGRVSRFVQIKKKFHLILPSAWFLTIDTYIRSFCGCFILNMYIHVHIYISMVLPGVELAVMS